VSALILCGAVTELADTDGTENVVAPSSHAHFPAVESTRRRNPYLPPPNALDAGHSRFPAANAGRIAMITPLSSCVMLTLLPATPRR